LPPGHFLRITNGRISLHKYWDLEFPKAGDERRVKDTNILVDEFEDIFHRAVKRRLHSDVPLVSYLSGGLDSSVILDAGSRLSGAPLPSFTIGMDSRTGPDESSNATEVANFVGSRLTTVPMNARKIAESFPEFIIATEAPVLDPSCAALMQLATEIHDQGYKVALTGEGADEAFAGYIWFKGQKISNMMGTALPRIMRKIMWSSIYRGQRRGMPVNESAINGIRPAQQLMYEALNLAREIFYSPSMWQELAKHDAYTDLDIPNERIQQWHPLNQSIYVNYKVMLAGLLLISKGDRIAMHSSVETRFPFLDEEVIQFCASIAPKYKLKGLTDKWLLRQFAGKHLPRQVAKRPKSMFRSQRSPIFLGEERPHWVDQLLSVESLQRSGYFDPEVVIRERARLTAYPLFAPRQHLLDAIMTSVISTQLWHHLFCGGGLCDLPVWQPPAKSNIV
jgi:asparagine synthase (glutamine-hydrolysing)